MWGTIATWRMAHDGVIEASTQLANNGSAGDAVEALINKVEAYPYYKSVGYGGLPNEEGVVEMDGAFMDGDTLAQGAVGGIHNVLHAVSVARSLSQESYNNFRVGAGATKYAEKQGFEMRNMLTDRAKARWENVCRNSSMIRSILIMAMIRWALSRWINTAPWPRQLLPLVYS